MNKLSVAIKLAIPLAIFSLNTQTAQAADNVELTESGLELTVTANRRPENVNRTLAPTSVITRNDIERTQATSVAEVLTRIPGLSISNSGGVGKATSVFIRGTNSGQVLVLVDGVRHGSATLGTTAFQHIPVEQIDRIEIVRGPRSSLYGSEAIGGVIQIFTRKGAEGFQPTLEVSAGSNDAYRTSVNLAGGNAKTTYNVNLQREKHQGIDACNSLIAGCFADQPDKDGYERNSVALTLSHQFSNSVKGDVSVLRAEGENEFDGNFQNEADFTQQVINARINADLSESFNLQFNVGQSLDESDNFLNGNFTGNFDTQRDNVSVLGDYAINDNNSLLFGADYYDDQVDSSTVYDLTSRYNRGLFTSYSGQFNKTQLDVSLRQDDNEQFGSKTTGGIAFGQGIGENLRIKASYGTAFKAPTFNQLYFPFDFGNPDLAPEESKNYELGIDGKFANSHWGVNLFQNDIDNLIVTTADFTTSENTDKSRIRGIEARFDTKLAGLDLSTNITMQKPENLSGVNSGKTLRLRPERILNIAVDRQFGRFKLGSSIHAESERFTNPDNSSSLGGFTTVDLRGEVEISKEVNLGLKIGNLLDKQYELNNGFNQDGINAMLTLKYAPKK